MINYDDITNENKTKHNPKWPYILYHPYRMLIIGVSGSGKTNALLNLINQQDNDDYDTIDKIYLYVKDPYEPKYEYLINKCKKMDKIISKTLKLILNIQMICKIFINILMNTIQKEKLIY